MKRVLVTGAAGFIGRQTLPFLRARGFEVHAADHRSVGAPDVVEHEVDLRDGRAVERLVAAVHPTHVLHLAWCTAHGEFWNSSENLDWVAGGVALIRAVEKTGGGRIVAAGSSAEYGAAGRCVEDETPIEPGTLYGTAKNAFRELLFARARLGGIQAAWGRVF
ncbi:MAG TPA: NAD-dependent epimerase/dehydratase family protein, partial [Polyangiaceae bacterium]